MSGVGLPSSRAPFLGFLFHKGYSSAWRSVRGMPHLDLCLPKLNPRFRAPGFKIQGLGFQGSLVLDSGSRVLPP